MFQVFASALFRDDVEELSQCSRPGDDKPEEEEDEEWILVNYLTDACSGHCDDLSGSRLSPEDEDDEEEEEEDLVMIPSPTASPAIRYPSCTSLNSVADTDPDGGVDEDEYVDDEEGGFLRLDACSLEESWFVTPPPCFTGRGSQPVLLETSPLENLLIEHPSMSVYAHHSPPRLMLNPLPQHSLEGKLDFLSSSHPSDRKTSRGKEKVRCTIEGSRHRQEVAVAQCRPNLHSPCYAATLSPNAGFLLQQRPGNAAQRSQPLSRKALRRHNLLRPPKTGTTHLHQPIQRHLNF